MPLFEHRITNELVSAETSPGPEWEEVTEAVVRPPTPTGRGWALSSNPFKRLWAAFLRGMGVR